MFREMFKSKIHRATVTDKNLNYNGSLSVGPDLREAADLLIGEKAQVLNVNSGSMED